MTRSTLTKRLLLSALECRLAPATFTVNSLTDSGAGTGSSGDLRYCITQAEANPGADMINATGVNGTISLGAELPTITGDLSIFGPGANKVAIAGNGSVRLLQVAGSGATQVDFQGLKFNNGSTTGSGGVALVNNAKTAFYNCVLTNNNANVVGGALSGTATSTMTIVDCSLSGNNGFAGGGAVYTTGALTIRNSTLSSNSTGPNGSGGAIGVNGAATVLVSNSTLSGNTAGVHGGAIRILSSFNGSFQLKNSTVTLNQVTDAPGTGRGISRPGSSGSVQIYSTVVAQNSGGATTTSDVAGTINADFCLFGTKDAATITGTFNLTGTNASPLNAKLGSLANNGGTTKTHLPMADSPALESGDNQDLLTEDQRGIGFIRTEGYTTDIGALDTEYFLPLAARIDPVVSTSSPNTTHQFTVTYYDPHGSKLIDYSELGTGDLYVTGPNGYYEIPTFISATPAADAATIVATYQIPVPVNTKAGWDISDNGNYPITVYPNEIFDKDTPTPNAGVSAAFALLRVEVPNVYTVDEATDIADGKTGPGEVSLREAIENANSDGQFSRIVFDSAVFNAATTIVLSGTELSITDALTIVGPTAPLTLDADGKSRIFNAAPAPALASIEISALKLMNGKAPSLGAVSGGGIYLSGQNLVLDHVTISNCYGNSQGGGFAAYRGTNDNIPNVVVLRDSQVTDNSAAFAGGGIFAGAVELNVLRSTIANNMSGNIGGGIIGHNSSVSVTDSTISGNLALDSFGGGGVYFRTLSVTPPLPPASLTMSNCTISSNSSAGRGGGIVYLNDSTGRMTLTNCTLTNNVGPESGGGILLRYHINPIALSSNIVAGNVSPTQPDIACGNPTSFTGANNLIGVGNVANLTIPPGNLSGTAASPLDAKLGPLANNGGSTKTHALLPGSPAINAGSNPSLLEFDQRGLGFSRTAGSGTDIGAYELQATKVTAVQINDGSPQRSRITSVTLTFDQPLNLLGTLDAAFELKRQSDNAKVTVSATPSGNTVTLTFASGPVEYGSLADGRYTLTVLANKLLNLDGDGNGSPGDNYVLASETNTILPPTNIFRLFGDADGDGAVSGADFNLFRTAFGGSNANFDFDNDGSVSASDFSQFRIRFGGSI